MPNFDPQQFHQMFGKKKTRIAYQARDLIDYVCMIAITAYVIYLVYRPGSVMAEIGFALCAIMILTFLKRNGGEVAWPIVLRRPQDIVFMLVYKIKNMTFMFIFAVATLLLQGYLIRHTPDLPHHAALMHDIAIWLFYIHLIFITTFRTVSLVDHLRKRDRIREILMQTAWKVQISKQQSVTLEVIHAYCTGLLTHIVLIAPWYFIIEHFKFSLLFLPAVLVVNFFTHVAYLKAYNGWFYRDHWLGHNSEFEFVYLHGTHHDALPSGLIGVSGNGFLEGTFRHSLGHPTPYYSPIFAFLLYSLEVFTDIVNHQYIPGVYPKVSRQFHETCQHSTHHFGRLEPYSVAVRNIAPAGDAAPTKERFRIIPREILNSIEIDERLTGFEWDNPRYRLFLSLYDKYQKP